jgi:hypothetical protein
MKYLPLILLFLSTLAYAQQDQIVVDGGVGVFNSGKNSLSETKILTIGEQEDLWNALKMRGIVGGWLDNAGGGKKDSVNDNGLIGGIFSGPALISSPDVLLGSNFEFMDDLHLGIQDKDSNYIGVYYRHLSDAGLSSVNIGRDVIGIELRF